MTRAIASISSHLVTYKSVIVLLFSSLLIASSTLSLAQTIPAPWVGDTFQGAPCRGAGAAFGPFDYTRRHSIPAIKLSVVEKHHFNSVVESLAGGMTSKGPYGDLNYTLRAWPNHPRALNSMSIFHFREKRMGRKLRPPPECWFKRALSFSPKDATAHTLYGIYLHKSKKYKAAEKIYLKSLELDPDSTYANYNYGLFLVERKKYKKAKQHAKKVYARSFPLLGLKNKLKKAGHWP